MRAMPTPSANEGPRFLLAMPVSELTERDTRAIEASVVSSATLVTEIEDEVMLESRMTRTEPCRARGLESPDPNSGIHLTGVQGLAHEGPKATSHQIEPGEKMQMSPSGLCPSRLEADKVISTFLFDPKFQPSP